MKNSVIVASKLSYQHYSPTPLYYSYYIIAFINKIKHCRGTDFYCLKIRFLVVPHIHVLLSALSDHCTLNILMLDNNSHSNEWLTLTSWHWSGKDLINVMFVFSVGDFHLTVIYLGVCAVNVHISCLMLVVISFSLSFWVRTVQLCLWVFCWAKQFIVRQQQGCSHLHYILMRILLNPQSLL